MSTATQAVAAAAAAATAAQHAAAAAENPLAVLAAFMTTGAGAALPRETKAAMAKAAMIAQTRIFVLPGASGKRDANDKLIPVVAPDGVTKNYSGLPMVAIAFGKGSDASGKTVICRPGKMREILARSAELLAACEQCEKLDAAAS